MIKNLNKKYHLLLQASEEIYLLEAYCLNGISEQRGIVREPVIGLIKWLRQKGLKVCSYVEKCAELKTQTLKKSAGTQKCYAQRNTPGVGNFSISTEVGYPIQQNLI